VSDPGFEGRRRFKSTKSATSSRGDVRRRAASVAIKDVDQLLENRAEESRPKPESRPEVVSQLNNKSTTTALFFSMASSSISSVSVSAPDNSSVSRMILWMEVKEELRTMDSRAVGPFHESVIGLQ